MKLVIKRNKDVSVNDFIKVRNTTNFVEYSYEEHLNSLNNSLYVVAVYNNDIPIGIGRVVGDNKTCFFIKDVIVIPSYKGLGIGKTIINNILDYIKEHAATNAYVALMASKESENFYKKFGFIKRPNENMGSGMIKFI